MIKKPAIITAVIFILIICSIFIYRYQIIQYASEKLIRKYLPAYVKIDSIRFDFGKGDVVLGGFKILDPPEFSKEYLVEIERITCHYKLRGKTILDGMELSGPVLNNVLLNVERLGNGKINLIAAQALIGASPEAADSAKETRTGTNAGFSGTSVNKKPSWAGRLPETLKISNGKIIFTDRMAGANPNILSFENIDAELALKTDEYYTKIVSLASAGQGYVNGDREEEVKWTMTLNPTTQRLTMSSRFDVYNVAITPFAPYYDRYSPFVFKKGKFSGVLIFDFDNGNIGSSNELRLAGLQFFIKPGYENAEFWQTTIPDLVKYFTSPYGEIVFDFKIKGDMSSPSFYLGPKSKKAVISMAVDKISAAIQKSAGGDGASPKNDLEKAKDYIDLFKGLIKKQ